MRVAILILGILTWAAPALAQPANAHFRAGVRAARERRWEDARAAFERAHRAAPSADTLFNLAGAEAQTGRLRAAAAHYREFLQVQPAPEEQTLAAARQMISAIEARLARLRITVQGAEAGDVVRIDGDVVPPTADALPIESGSHRITLERGGSVIAESTVQLADGQAATVTLSAPPPVPMILDGSAGTEPIDEGETETGGGGFPWIWVGIGAAAVVLVVVVIALASSGADAEPTQGTLGRVPVELLAW